MTVDRRYEPSNVLKLAGKLMLAFLIGFTFIMLILAAYRYIIDGSIFLLLIFIDTVVFSIPLFLSLLASCIIYWFVGNKYLIVAIIPSLIYYFIAMAMMNDWAKKVGLAQYIEMDAIYTNGEINELGIIINSLPQILIAITVFLLVNIIIRPVYNKINSEW